MNTSEEPIGFTFRSAAYAKAMSFNLKIPTFELFYCKSALRKSVRFQMRAIICKMPVSYVEISQASVAQFRLCHRRRTREDTCLSSNFATPSSNHCIGALPSLRFASDGDYSSVLTEPTYGRPSLSACRCTALTNFFSIGKIRTLSREVPVKTGHKARLSFLEMLVAFYSA